MKTREVVNTTMDIELKHMVEATRGIHNISFGELLDKAARELLISLNQEPIIDQEIARKDFEVSKIIQEQTELRTLKEQIKKLKIPGIENKNNGDGDKAKELESYRNKRFLEVYAAKEKLDLLKINLKKGNVNWERITELYKFKDKDEARTWIERRVEGSEL
jgi:hypothetical protein